jgi:hypothetical protein
MADPVFGALGTLDSKGATAANSMSSTLTDVTAGDLLFVLAQRDDQDLCTGVASASPAVSFTSLGIQMVSPADAVFGTQLWAAVAPSSTASMSITASYSTSESWGAMFSWRMSPGSITAISPVNGSSSYDGTLPASTTTNRTAPNIVTTARCLLLAVGADWDFYYNHTAATNWTKRVDCDTFGDNTTTQFVHERIADAGTYPSGNFATSSSADYYMSILVAIEIPASGGSSFKAAWVPRPASLGTGLR